MNDLEIENIENSFVFLEEVKKELKEKTIKMIDENFPIAKEVAEIEKIERKKLPSHFNLLDLIVRNVYEPKHSKILGALLKYKHKEKFLFLNSFLEFLEITCSKNYLEPKLEFPKIENPTIEVEKDNIDILIQDKNFAFIIENKINYASDRDKQIKRYVNTVEDLGYDISKIYVAYLTRWGGKVKESSLPKKLEKELGNRYLEINYRNHILPWLENILLDVPLKEETLISGIRQYIDYLKGEKMFNLRKENKNIMENITKILKEKLELENKNNTEKLEIIQEKRDEFGSCINGLDYLKDEINSEIIERRNSLRREFCKKLNEKLKDENTGWRHIQAGWTECDFNPVSLNFGFRNDNNELIYKINNKELYLHIQINDWQVFACGFSYPPEDEEMKKIITEDIQHYFKNKGINLISGNPWWRAILSSDCYTPYENIAQSFYNDEHNETFQKKMDKIVDVFFNQVKRMFEIWRQFNEEKK